MSILRYLFLCLANNELLLLGSAGIDFSQWRYPQGTIVDYQARSDMLTFRSDDGKQTRFKGAQLDDESFKYVRSWAAAEAFMDPTQFRVYVYGPNKVKNWIKRTWRRPPGKVEPHLSYEIKLERIGYDLKYDNQTGFDLENVQIKYCLFYDRLDLIGTRKREQWM